MASKCRIFLHRTKDSIHLKLDGVLNGKSANELLQNLMTHSTGFCNIFIYTDDIMTVYPSGRDILQRNLEIFRKKCRKLVFVGENKHNILTDWKGLC